MNDEESPRRQERTDRQQKIRECGSEAAVGGASLASTFADDDKTLSDSCEVSTSREASPLTVRKAGDGSPAAAATSSSHLVRIASSVSDLLHIIKQRS